MYPQVTGWSEKIHMDHFAFEEQYQTFQNYGFAANPSVNANDVIGDAKAFEQKRGEGVSGTWYIVLASRRVTYV